MQRVTVAGGDGDLAAAADPDPKTLASSEQQTPTVVALALSEEPVLEGADPAGTVPGTS